MKVFWIYITAPDREEARRLAATLVEERLAACVNILGVIDSVYRWQGEIEQASEIALVAKTDEARVAALTRRAAELHSYECPCIVALPIAQGHPPFLEWIRSN